MSGFAASAAHHERASRAVAGGVNSNVRLRGRPICFERALGSRLFDIDGNEYIDYALGMGPAIFGHAPAFLIDAVAQSLSLGQVFAGQHALEIECANLLRELVPSAELVRIGSTGSEMVQVALRVARAHTGRQKIVKFEGHYHGWLDSVLVNQSGPAHDPQGDVPFPLHLQSAGQALNAASDTNVLPWNDIGALERYLGTYGSRTAAVIMEPVMCNTGVIAPRPGYLQAVRELCSQHAVVLVMDEVITGFRVAPGGAQQLFDVRADLSVFAKALGGGFPVAALGGRADIMQLIGSGRVNHSGTYNANVTSVAACVATLRHLQRDGEPIHAHIERIGSSLIQGFRRIAASRAPDLRVSGFPSVFHTHFGADDVTDYYSYGRTDARRLDRLMEALLEKGVRPMSRGTWFVSASHTDTDVDITLDAVDRTLAEL